MKKILVVSAIALVMVLAIAAQVYSQGTTTTTGATTTTTGATTTTSIAPTTSTTIAATTSTTTAASTTTKRARLPRTGGLPINPLIPLGTGSALLALSYLRRLKR